MWFEGKLRSDCCGPQHPPRTLHGQPRPDSQSTRNIASPSGRSVGLQAAEAGQVRRQRDTRGGGAGGRRWARVLSCAGPGRGSWRDCAQRGRKVPAGGQVGDSLLVAVARSSTDELSLICCSGSSTLPSLPSPRSSTPSQPQNLLPLHLRHPRLRSPINGLQRQHFLCRMLDIPCYPPTLGARRS